MQPELLLCHHTYSIQTFQLAPTLLGMSQLRNLKARTPHMIYGPHSTTNDLTEPATSDLKVPASSTPATVKAPGGRTKPSRRFASQPTKLEAIDDGLGPLGPLGANAPAPVEADEPPALPQKENVASRSARPKPGASHTIDGEEDGDDNEYRSPTGARIPPPVQPPSGDGPRRQTQPGMSVEEAAKPSFNIAVGDPHKVGDLTSSHTVYQVRTTVRIGFVFQADNIF